MEEQTRESFGVLKTIPSVIKEAVLEALSFYPALKNVKIDFIFNQRIRKSFMQAQPRITSMVGSRKRRTYIVKIKSVFSLNGELIPVHRLPKDVIVGWIGHELGHIMDYMRKDNWSMLLFGLNYYFSKSFIITAERAADIYALNHGLGGYLLTTKDFILHKAGMSENYISRIKRLYFPPEEIMVMMDEWLSEDGNEHHY
ncbi:MAG: hypothetical protein ACLFQA_00615 [Bacteroidales bacterium]